MATARWTSVEAKKGKRGRSREKREGNIRKGKGSAGQKGRVGILLSKRVEWVTMFGEIQAESELTKAVEKKGRGNGPPREGIGVRSRRLGKGSGLGKTREWKMKKVHCRAGELLEFWGGKDKRKGLGVDPKGTPGELLWGKIQKKNCQERKTRDAERKGCCVGDATSLGRGKRI